METNCDSTTIKKVSKEYASLWEAELMETETSIFCLNIFFQYASLWEAELMETFFVNVNPITVFSVRFPLGSGINGNSTDPPSKGVFSLYASLWEAELMETFYRINQFNPNF